MADRPPLTIGFFRFDAYQNGPLANIHTGAVYTATVPEPETVESLTEKIEALEQKLSWLRKERDALSEP